MKAKRWLCLFALLSLAVFLAAGSLVAWVDPFFHYHAPHDERFFYPLDSERSQDDGIVRNFDFDAMITGSSMTANFKTSELDALFGTHAVKVPAAGASFYEINNLISTALRHQPALKLVVRSIDRNLLVYGSDELRDDLGEYPTYLYDRNLFNDYKYLLNADVVFGRTAPMLLGTEAGRTSFDDYSSTNELYKGRFGLPDLEELLYFPLDMTGEPRSLSPEQRQKLIRNITRNVIAEAEAHPDVTFYCFLPPYSLAYWHDRIAFGDIYAQLEAEQIAAEYMLQCENIRLFDFSCRRDIISDMNNYRDLLHYGEWINSLILKWMRDDQYRLTPDNYEEHFHSLLDYYLTYDYQRLVTQPRHGCDYYAAALLNRELTGAVPRMLTEEELRAGELRHAELKDEDGMLVLSCTGALARDEEQDLGGFLRDRDYIGLKLFIPDAGAYSYLCFLGRNTALNGRPCVFVYDENGAVVSSLAESAASLHGGWQRFAVDLRGAGGPVSVIFSGGSDDRAGHPASSFEFADFELY